MNFMENRVHSSNCLMGWVFAILAKSEDYQQNPHKGQRYKLKPNVQKEKCCPSCPFKSPIV